MIDVILECEEDEKPYANIPQLVIHHSPDGFSWGYQGSGCADLALNILELALLSQHFKGKRVKCWKGSCFEKAWQMHQEYKRQVIARIPKEGGTITGESVLQWIANWHE